MGCCGVYSYTDTKDTDAAMVVVLVVLCGGSSWW